MASAAAQAAAAARISGVCRMLAQIGEELSDVGLHRHAGDVFEGELLLLEIRNRLLGVEVKPSDQESFPF